MQVHHGFEVDGVAANTVNYGVREGMEVELAIVVADFAPALGFGHDAAQGPFELVKEVVTQARLPLFIPQRRAFQFLVGFRMTDDVH